MWLACQLRCCFNVRIVEKERVQLYGLRGRLGIYAESRSDLQARA